MLGNIQSHNTYELRTKDSNELLHRFRPVSGQEALFVDRKGVKYTHTEVAKIIKKLSLSRVEAIAIPTQDYMATEDLVARKIRTINTLALNIKHKTVDLPKEVSRIKKIREYLSKINDLLEDIENECFNN